MSGTEFGLSCATPAFLFLRPMSFFFHAPAPLSAVWTVGTRSQSTPIAIAFAGGALWRDLGPPPRDAPVYISLTAANPRGATTEETYVQCQAKLDEGADDRTISIPSTWLKTYPGVFASQSPNGVLVQLITPTTLTSVVVTALSNEAYVHACSDGSALEHHLFEDQAILRQGDVLGTPNEKLTTNNQVDLLQYRLDMVEPVLQGLAKRGETKIIILASQDDPCAIDIDSLEDISEEQDDQDDDFEINENFLGNSVLSTSASELVLNHKIHADYPNGHAEDHSSGLSPKSFTHPPGVAEDDRTLYLRTTELGRLGVLSGDWAIANAKSSNSRLVRIVANDVLTELPNTITGSPLLLHNIINDEVESYSSQLPLIFIRPSPFGAINPAIPTARSVTIARVASPISTNRQYQHLFLNSLKVYLDSTRRLMKQGDLIIVSIDTDFSRISVEDTKQDNATGPNENTSYFAYPNHAPRLNEAVFFKVTNIEYDVVSRASSSTQDLYTGSTLGELGCWIDTSVTRVIQAGVEYSRVPDVRSYVGIDIPGSNILAKLSAQPFSYLLSPQSPFSKILSLTSAALFQKAVDYDLQLSFLLKGGRSIGKFTVASWVAQQLGLHLFEVNCYDIIGESDVKTEAMLEVRLEQARSCTPCLLILRHLEALSQNTQAAEPGKEPSIVNVLRESLVNMQSSWRLTGYPVIVLGTTSESGRVPPSLLSCFKQEIVFEAPNEGERLEIINCLLADANIGRDVSLQNIATQTAALLAGDLRDLVARAKTASVERTMNTRSSRISLGQISLTAADFDVALGTARASYSESIGAPKIPSVSWDDVGGLAHVKTDILDTIQLPLDHPELFADGLKKRSGILLYGPPGTGKTLIAKAVATSCALNFFSVKGPELLNMYIGESEANVRRVFQRARDAKPCVIFFDELDSVAPKRGNHGDSGGVMDRIVSQLLAELDGMAGGGEGADVFVIGATNRPDLLDPALLRPGRFDRMLYLGVSDTHEAQLNILDALTRKFRLDPALDLRKVAEKCPFNYTGADFYALCSDAMLNAMSRKAEAIEEKIQAINAEPGPHAHPHPLTPQYYLAELATPEEIMVYVSDADFQRALDMLVPSVSQAEMAHYAEVQRRFSQAKSIEGEAP
ncbi:AAA-domain-containing protein [Pholiota conissans]|uniref:Peroxisomal ATPase PEX6 n=1 Tax=Pholiota conissans TaxID=109636 RepID=A0A9P5YT28_9AGAR|nr:AAA-domain-containing protein [Pholiota conissans]